MLMSEQTVHPDFMHSTLHNEYTVNMHVNIHVNNALYCFVLKGNDMEMRELSQPYVSLQLFHHLCSQQYIQKSSEFTLQNKRCSIVLSYIFSDSNQNGQNSFQSS